MNWIIGAILSFVAFEYAKSKGWIKNPLFGDHVTCDIESDMPASLKNVVLGELASEKDPNKLIQLAQTFNPLYPMAAYCLMHQAWCLLGKKGPEPQPPSQAMVAQAAAARAAQAAAATPSAVAAAASPTPAGPPVTTAAPAQTPDTQQTSGAPSRAEMR